MPKLLLLTSKRKGCQRTLSRRASKNFLDLKVCKTKGSTYSSVTLTSPVAMSLTDKQASSFRVMLYLSPEQGRQLPSLSKPKDQLKEDLVQDCF
jgi:hypothetical protein